MSFFSRHGKTKQEFMERFFNLNLTSKLMIVMYSGIIAIFLFLSILMIILSYSNNIADQKREGREWLYNGMNIAQHEIKYTSGIADYLELAGDIQTMMIRSNSGQSPGGPTETLAAVSRQKHAVSIVIYDRAGHALDYVSIDGSSGPLDQPADDPEHPLHVLMEEKKTFVWQYIPENEETFMRQDNSPKLCLWKSVKSSKDRSIIGSIAISIDVRKLMDSGGHLGNAYWTIMIINDKNQEVFNKTDIPLTEEIITGLNALDTAIDNRVSIGNTSYWAFLSRVTSTDLKMVYLLPTWRFRKGINAFAVYTIAAVALFILLLIPLFSFISKSITKPLNRLTASMEDFARGNFASHVNFRYSDEVGRLGHVFNYMVSKNKQLINSNYVLKLREKESELALLQSQINPHFIYNVVNSIQWLAVKNQDKETADLIYSLGRIFRINLGMQQKMWTVRQEIDFLYNYMKLQKQCYGNRFDFSVDIEEGVGEIFIPRLTIQPLVENSIHHGVDSSSEKVVVLVKVFLSDDRERIHLLVSDDGPGIAPEILALLPDHLPPAEPESHGNRSALKNISDRLKITYGADYSFTISSVPYEKTIVEIKIPVADSATERKVMVNDVSDSFN